MNQRKGDAKIHQRTYSRYSSEAATLLGALIREARNECKLTVQELADRAVSKPLFG
jgi:hypothetical protein